MNTYIPCHNREFAHRQGCVFSDFHNFYDDFHAANMIRRTRLPTNPLRRVCQLQNRNGFFLTISKGMTIVATKNRDDESSKVQISSMGHNLISISPKDSMLYLAVDKDGRIFFTKNTKDVKIDQFIFEEKMDDTFHVAYKLKAYRGKRAWYLSIDGEGNVSMIRCLPGLVQPSTQFCVTQLKKRHSL